MGFPIMFYRLVCANVGRADSWYRLGLLAPAGIPVSGTQQSAWSFTPFFAGTVAISLIVTALFNASRGSILLPALMHIQLINPIWPDAQPHDTLFFVAAAVLVVWFNRKAMFSREGAVMEVIPKTESRMMPRGLNNGTDTGS